MSLKKIIYKTSPFLLLVFLAFGLIYGAYLNTPTYDEPANMAASFDYVYRNEFRLYPDNPPLIKYLAGLSLFPIKNNINFPSDLEIYTQEGKFDLYAFGKEFVYQSGNNARQIQFLSRMPNILITLSLGLMIYFFARDLFGRKAGLFALFLYSFDPNIRGHGHILAFDIPLAFITTSLLFASFQLIKSRGRKTFLYLIIALIFGLGVLTKFTFVFVSIIYFLSLFMYVLIVKKPLINFKQFTAVFLVCLLSSIVFLWGFGLSTNYRKNTFSYKEVLAAEHQDPTVINSWKWRLIENMPAPYFYKAGMKVMHTHNVYSQPAFLLGEVQAKNNWFLYFPVSFILKTPIATQLVIYLAIIIVISMFLRGKRMFIRKYAFFLFGAFFMLFMMIFSHINNVYRYLFPTLALFILGASQIASENILRTKNREPRTFLLFVICYLFFTSVLSFPFDLSYTNELTGIPPKGYKFLSDSEIDWGQDLERLAYWLKENGYQDQEIMMSYLGTADPEYYGIKYKQLKFEDLNNLSGLLVISAGNLTLGDWMWTSSTDYKIGLSGAPLDMLRERAPNQMIGKSIFIYKL